MKRARSAAAFVALVVLFVASAVHVGRTAPDPSIDADQIFNRARERWVSQKHDATLASTIRIGYTVRGRARVENYRSLYDAATDTISTQTISEEEAAHPHVPHGFNVDIFLIPVSKPEFVDALGVPDLSPTFAFGLDQTRHAVAPQAESTALPTIGRVLANTGIYRVERLADDICDGSPAYHLRLTPLRDPIRFRLREAWFRDDDFSTCRLDVSKNFRGGPGWNVPWTIAYTRLTDGTMIIASERSRDPMTSPAGTLTDVSIDFVDVAPAREDAVTGLRMLGLSTTSGAVFDEPPP